MTTLTQKQTGIPRKHSLTVYQTPSAFHPDPSWAAQSLALHVTKLELGMLLLEEGAFSPLTLFYQRSCRMKEQSTVHTNVYCQMLTNHLILTIYPWNVSFFPRLYCCTHFSHRPNRDI